VQPHIEPHFQVPRDQVDQPKLGWPALFMASILLLLIVAALVVHLR
jgi:hypothetical protein